MLNRKSLLGGIIVLFSMIELKASQSLERSSRVELTPSERCKQFLIRSAPFIHIGYAAATGYLLLTTYNKNQELTQYYNELKGNFTNVAQECFNNKTNTPEDWAYFSLVQKLAYQLLETCPSHPCTINPYSCLIQILENMKCVPLDLAHYGKIVEQVYGIDLVMKCCNS